jgi:hypothetical protein
MFPLLAQIIKGYVFRVDDLVKSKISPSRLGVTGGDDGEGDK